MSLSLVLADFGTLLFCFFLVVIFYSLSFLFCFFGAITLTFLIIRIRANLSKVKQGTKRTAGILALISKPLYRDSLLKIYNPNGEKQRERLSSDWAAIASFWRTVLRF